MKNNEEIEEFSKDLEKMIALDEREIKHETNKLLCYLRMKKRTKIDEIKIVKTIKNVAHAIKNLITEKLL